MNKRNAGNRLTKWSCTSYACLRLDQKLCRWTWGHRILPKNWAAVNWSKSGNICRRLWSACQRSSNDL